MFAVAFHKRYAMLDKGAEYRASEERYNFVFRVSVIENLLVK